MAGHVKAFRVKFLQRTVFHHGHAAFFALRNID
jgi:hypothetical protein